MTTRRLRHSPLSTSSVQHQNSIQTFIESKTGGGIRFAVAVQSGCTNLGLGMLFRSNNQGSVKGRIGCSHEITFRKAPRKGLANVLSLGASTLGEEP